MNNDGWGFTGSGQDDNRLAGMDLQHNVQKRTADELHVPVRIVTQPRESGGPMKEHMEHEMHEHHEHKHPMHAHMEEEKMRHEHAMEHHKNHLEKHHGRHFDSQHGHDNYKY